ncbi:hypothetical protein DL96DRAFT_1685812 [Flagelloscypha sp. PMI_526]|nr:hypothetical protein DL96DRAFT_1685812 [Flagelloscypha sp. PMI_526]
MVLTATLTIAPLAILYYPAEPTRRPGFMFSPVFSAHDPIGDAPVKTELVGAMVGAMANNGVFTGQVTSIEFYTNMVTTTLSHFPVNTVTFWDPEQSTSYAVTRMIPT